ncbi:hypothetical protein BVRB_015150 [Beta vulgaris subsp. vulgaris]|uniref:Uncharacterized protein n=1 Tax=Beta vulgaris subsp. vulgaris TaxID=3555 RepID=A0A0J8B1D6_BETVV|nr:hypothetical protein BVRB_015150 [Beta vulgaris subsp. vulgaris]
MQLSPSSDLIMSSNVASNPPQQIILPPLKLYDIRHLSSSSTKDLPTGPTLVPTGPHLKGHSRIPVFDSDQLSINDGNDNEGEDDQSTEKQSIFSGESTEGSIAGQMSESEVQLELTLGFNKYGEMRY